MPCNTFAPVTIPSHNSLKYLIVCKPDSHPAIEEFRTGIALGERVERVRRGKQTATYRYRWLCDVPLRGDAKAMPVNWLEIQIADANGTVTYRNSCITDLPLHRDNVAELAACGRARWKIENETFNVLKTKGYNLEHNFGHAKRHLASVLATLNLLAFAIHTVCDLGDRAWKAARRGWRPSVTTIFWIPLPNRGSTISFCWHPESARRLSLS